ncbi:MAG TPA: efflux RND transporter periplasmic adaptor subunit [Verrucomicrobiae bacterium]|nr:efflux RND transporter periplasmic adaptor subunit [Verrucomicrobiae bacterium]
MATKKGKRKILVFSIIGLVLVGLTLFAIFSKHEAVITIQKEKVTRRNLTELVVANGKVQPVHQVAISPEVSGEIIDLPVKEGQCVKQGDLLVKIRPDNYVAARDSADANYKYSLANRTTAEANLEKADLELTRYNALLKSKLVSDSDYLTVKTTFDVAKATFAGATQQVAVAHAALQTSEADLSKTTIYSPIYGTVTKLNSEKGERVVGTAMMAGTEIMTVADLNEMETRVDIGEIDIVLVKTGQVARLEVDAFKDRKFSGVVTEIANSANNAATATASSSAASSSSSSTDATKFQVKIRILEKESFRPGMSVTAEVESRYRTNVLTVPYQSVTTRLPKEATGKSGPGGTNATETNIVQVAGTVPPLSSDTNSIKSADHKPGEAPKPIEAVFVVNGDRVKMVPVKRGISDDTYTEIVEGLDAGQEIVSGGYKAINRELEDGKKVVVGKILPTDKGEEKK